MLSEEEKAFLMKKVCRDMMKKSVTLREIIDLHREIADYLESVLVESENH